MTVVKNIFLLAFVSTLISFFACTSPSSNTCVPDTAYSETDATSISFDFEIPKGKNIHEVMLTVNTGIAQSPIFLITRPGNPQGIMVLGTTYDSDIADPNSGIQFIISSSGGSGNYELHIFAKPVGVAIPGTFTGTGVDTWNFQVTNLIYGSDPSGEITSWDASFDPVMLAEDSKTEECDIASLMTVTATSTDNCIPLITYSKTDKTSILFDFEVPKGKNIHEVILSVNTGVAQTPTFAITLPGSIPSGITLGTSYDTNVSNPNAGMQFYVTLGPGTGNYELHIFAKPVLGVFPGTFTGTDVDTWNFTVNNLAAGTDPSGEIQSWDDNLPSTQLFENAGTTECDISYFTHIE